MASKFHHFMANRWGNNGNSDRLYFLTAHNDCSHEVKRHFLLGRNGMKNLDSILKSRDITLPTNVHLVQSYGFSNSHVWMWELDHKEGWYQRIDAFELWCWRLLRVLWTARRSNQSILKEISPYEYSLEGLMLKLKLNNLATWCEELTYWKRSCCWERQKSGEEWDDRDKIVGWHHWLTGQEFEQALEDGEGKGSLVCCNPRCCKESDMTVGLNSNEV